MSAGLKKTTFLSVKYRLGQARGEYRLLLESCNFIAPDASLLPDNHKLLRAQGGAVETWPAHIG